MHKSGKGTEEWQREEGREKIIILGWKNRKDRGKECRAKRRQ
jgi:hypothetical protein